MAERQHKQSTNLGRNTRDETYVLSYRLVKCHGIFPGFCDSKVLQFLGYCVVGFCILDLYPDLERLRANHLGDDSTLSYTPSKQPFAKSRIGCYCLCVVKRCHYESAVAQHGEVPVVRSGAVSGGWGGRTRLNLPTTLSCVPACTHVCVPASSATPALCVWHQ